MRSSPYTDCNCLTMSWVPSGLPSSTTMISKSTSLSKSHNSNSSYKLNLMIKSKLRKQIVKDINQASSEQKTEKGFIRDMFEHKVNDESDVETFIVSRNNYTHVFLLLVFLLHFTHINLLIQLLLLLLC